MNVFSKNIAQLRKLKKLSQEQMADQLNITKSRLGAYEEGRAEPPLSLLIRFSSYFRLPVDILIKNDLSRADSLPQIEIGNQRILFPITVDKSNRGLVEIVDVRASAGYLNGYADPEYIEDLPTMQLPFGSSDTLRAFMIQGDSMPPLQTGALVIGKFVDDYKAIKNGKTYVVLTKEEGVVYKRVFLKDEENIELQSDNILYHPYEVQKKDILELWEFVCCISREDAGPDKNKTDMMQMLREMKRDLDQIKKVAAS